MFAGARFLLFACWLLAVGGCVCCDDRSRDACCPSSRALGCRPAERQPIVADVSLVPLPSDVVDARTFCALAEQETQCLAATNATIANLLVQEAEVAKQRSTGHHASRNPGSALTAELLQLEAIQQRNEASSNALQAFLRLVEAEGGVDNLHLRGGEIDLMLADLGRLQQQGLLLPVPKSDVESQRLELEHRQSDLRSNLHKLNYQLRELLGVEVVNQASFWPEANLAVHVEVPDREAAVNLALANRADLAALRLAAAADDDESAAAVRALLQLAGGGLGLEPATPRCLILVKLAHSSDGENAVRSRQLRELHDDRRRLVREEVLQATALIETRLEQIGLTKRRIDFATKHHAAAVQQQQAVGGTPLNVRKARLEILSAEQDLLHDVIEWKIAEVQLKAAQGLLAVECGYDRVSRVCPVAGR